jgi:Flp pilus assembly protein TadG
MGRFRHLQRDERGMTLAFIALGLTAMLAASTLAIDVGMFMTARSQAQNSADAGALAGATALAFNDYNDRSVGGPAVQSALNTATENDVMGKTVDVTPADVTFPVGPSGIANRVKVNVYRTASRNNPVSTLIGTMFGVNNVDIAATATAEASPSNAMTCVKPFTIPDRWVERGDPSWTPDSEFQRYDKKGNLLPNPDEYIPPGQAGYRGYDSTLDKGLELMIRAGTGNNVSPSFYFSWAMPGGTGASYYRDNIAGCNNTVVHFGDPMTPEPGNMVGPTMQGVDDLLALDPNARWDPLENKVDSPYGSRSPRVFPIPLYDPEYYQSGVTTGRNVTLKVANWVGFFIERRAGNNVYGRITPIQGIIDNNAGPAPQGTFPYTIRLVE